MLPDIHGLTAFHLALQGKSPNIVAMLIEKFGRGIIDLKLPGDVDIFQFMLQTRSFVSFKNIFSMKYPNEHPLVYGTAHGSIDLLTFIITPLDINTVTNSQGQSLVKIAIDNEQWDTALFLLAKGFNCDFTDLGILASKLPLEKIMFLKHKANWPMMVEGRETFPMFSLRKPFNPVLFKFAVKCGINPDERDPSTGISPLIKIIQENNTTALKILLQNGFPPLFDGKQSLIGVFARAKNSVMLMTLLSNGVDQKEIPGELPPLQIAVASRPSALITYKSSEDLTLRDLQYLFDIRIFERNFGAALVLLAQKKEITVKYILDAANSNDVPALFFYIICSEMTPSQISEIRMKSPVKNPIPHQMTEFFFQEDLSKIPQTKLTSLLFGDCTILTIAAKYSSKDMFERLIKKGLDIDAEDKEGYRPIDNALDACRFDNLAILAKYCVSCNSIQPECPTILHTLANNPRLKYYMQNATEEELADVKSFVEYAQSQGQLLSICDFNGMTPLLIAATNGNFILCEIFMSLGAVNDYIDNYITYVHILLDAYKQDIGDPFASRMDLFRYSTTEPRPPVKKICTIAANVFPLASNMNSFSEDNILHICAKLNLPVLCEYILRKGDVVANKNAKNGNGDTALHIAAKAGNIQLAQILVENGCNVNVINDMQQTPLMVALMTPHNMVALYLISVGSAFNIYDVSLLTPLHYASMNMNFDVAHTLINEGAPVNFADIYGRTPVYYAAKTASANTLSNYLAAKANIFITDYKGRTPLHAACQAGNAEIVSYLINSYPTAFADDDRLTPLHLACKHDKPNIVEYYVNKQDGLNLRDCRGDTPMHTAVRKDNVACVEVLIRIGANPMIVNFAGETPIVLAAAKGKKKCLTFFLQVGLKLNPEDGYLALKDSLLAGDFDYATELIKLGVSVRAHHWGRCLLTLAVVQKRLDIVKFLCLHKVMETLDRMDLAPFAYAYIFDQREILDEMLKQYPGKRQNDILDMFSPDLAKRREAVHKSTPEEVNAIRQNILHAPLMKVPPELKDKGAFLVQILVNAIHDGNAALISSIFDYGMNPNATFDNQTLLSIAVEDNQYEVAEFLIKRGADPCRFNRGTQSYPLILAIRLNRINFVKLFIENGARLDILNQDEESLLHIVIKENMSSYCKILCQYGANVHAVDKKGKTPLHLAAEKGSLESVELLIGSGARRDMKDNDGKTALEIAIGGKITQIIHILETNKV